MPRSRVSEDQPVAPDAATATAGSAARESAARHRIIQAADRLFYGEGIRHVPVDRVIAEAGVSRATFYRHFTGKEELVRAYVQARDLAVRRQFAAVTAAAGDGDVFAAIVAELAAQPCLPGFRGCPFINAAAEYPDPDDPVHRAVRTHRAWFRAALTDVARRRGVPDPDQAAATLVLLRDAAMVSGYLDYPDNATATVQQVVDRLFGS